MHFITDTDTENCFLLESIFVADADTAVLCSFDIADKDYFGHNFDFVADTDTEKYYF